MLRQCVYVLLLWLLLLIMMMMSDAQSETNAVRFFGRCVSQCVTSGLQTLRHFAGRTPDSSLPMGRSTRRYSHFICPHSHMTTFSPKQQLDVNVTAWGTNLASIRLRKCLSSARYCRLGQSGWSGPRALYRILEPRHKSAWQSHRSVFGTQSLSGGIAKLPARRRGGLGLVSS